MAKKKMTKNVVADRLFELKERLQQKMVVPERKGRVARVQDCIQEGKPIAVIKPFKGGDHQYEIGDIYDYKGVRVSKVSQLAEHNFLEDGVEVSSYREFLAIRAFYDNKVLPVEMRLATARTKAQKKAQQVAVALAAVRDAENVQRDAIAFMQLLEDELELLLTGPDAEDLQ